MYRIRIAPSESLGYLPSSAKIKLWVKAALRHKVRRGEVSVCFMSAKEIQALNKIYRHKDKPTNILSFKADLPAAVQMKVPLLGDLVICPAIVNEEAKAQGKTAQAHWAHILIHGSLHLLGYDHEIEKEAQVMEGKEIRLLKSLGFSNPYQVNEITE